MSLIKKLIENVGILDSLKVLKFTLKYLIIFLLGIKL